MVQSLPRVALPQLKRQRGGSKQEHSFQNPARGHASPNRNSKQMHAGFMLDIPSERNTSGSFGGHLLWDPCGGGLSIEMKCSAPFHEACCQNENVCKMAG